MTRTPEEMNEAVGEAIGQVMADEGVMVLKWFTCVEVMEGDGDRALWAIAPNGQKAWDSLGLIRFADHLEAAGLVHDDGSEE